MEKYEASTLKKGLQILDLLQANQALTLKEIYDDLTLSKTTAYRLIQTLERMDYVTKKGMRYSLSKSKFFPSKKYTSVDWTSLKGAYQLGKQTGESVLIGTLQETELVMRQVIKPPFNEPYNPEIGNRSPAHLSAIGKVILAHLDMEEQQDLLSELSLIQATDQTFAEKDLFLHHLNVIEQQGFAIDDEERFVGVRCIAAPIFYENQIIAAVAIAGSDNSIKKSYIRGLTTKVVAASREITKEINLSL